MVTIRDIVMAVLSIGAVAISICVTYILLSKEIK